MSSSVRYWSCGAGSLSRQLSPRSLALGISFSLSRIFSRGLSRFDHQVYLSRCIHRKRECALQVGKGEGGRAGEERRDGGIVH